MKIEISCPCCDEKFQVIIPVINIDEENNLNEQAILEQELSAKHNILLG
ncbi:hypothetical protein [Lacrimispora sp.]|nr:hypothetical protein [Lacrimispora sp.]